MIYSGWKSTTDPANCAVYTSTVAVMCPRGIYLQKIDHDYGLPSGALGTLQGTTGRAQLKPAEIYHQQQINSHREDATTVEERQVRNPDPGSLSHWLRPLKAAIGVLSVRGPSAPPAKGAPGGKG